MLKCQQLLAFYHLWAGWITCSVELSKKSFITSGPGHSKCLRIEPLPCCIIVCTSIMSNFIHLTYTIPVISIFWQSGKQCSFWSGFTLFSKKQIYPGSAWKVLKFKRFIQIFYTVVWVLLFDHVVSYVTLDLWCLIVLIPDLCPLSYFVHL